MCICYAHLCSLCEWSDCNLSSATFICKYSCVLLFCAWISLTHFEKATAVRKLARVGVALKRSITYAIPGLFWETMAYKRAFHVNSAILDSLFYFYSAIVNSFVIAIFFLDKHYILQYYRWLTSLSLCLFKPMFWSKWLLLWVWWNRVPAAIPVHYVFW